MCLCTGKAWDEGPTLTEKLLYGTVDMDAEPSRTDADSLGASAQPASSSKAETFAPASVPSRPGSVAESVMQDVSAAPPPSAAAISGNSRPMSLREKAKLHGWGKPKP
jgi:hypothetical protein